MIKVSTAGRDGRIVKRVTVYTNDPKNRVVRLIIKGRVEPYIRVRPRYVILNVTPGKKAASTVTITPNRNFSFRILDVSSDLDKYIRYSIKPLDNREGYKLIIENIQNRTGTYHGHVYLKTDLGEKRELRISVRGRVVKK